MFWYLVVMLAPPHPNGQNNHPAGVGAVILSVPTLVTVAFLLGCGGLVGR
jgi:hypothetical protein